MCILLFMAPIVAPKVCRYTVNQTLGGQPVVNVLDMVLDEGAEPQSREEQLFEVAGDILNNWTDHILAFQCDDLEAVSVSWLDLSSLAGSRGERTSTSTNTWPENGGNVTQAVMPAVVAARIDKSTSGGRGTKGGRMYLAGMPEARTPEGSALSWDSATVDLINDYLSDFLDGINDQQGPYTDTRALCVNHTRDGEYIGSSIVQTLTLNSLVATQVRRGALR